MSSINLHFDSVKPFDTAQAMADASGLSYWMIRDLCIKGDIPFISSGNKRLICKQGFIDYLEKKMQENIDHE